MDYITDVLTDIRSAADPKARPIRHTHIRIH
jgi:hypothetical protein